MKFRARADFVHFAQWRIPRGRLAPTYLWRSFNFAGISEESPHTLFFVHAKLLKSGTAKRGPGSISRRRSSNFLASHKAPPSARVKIKKNEISARADFVHFAQSRIPRGLLAPTRQAELRPFGPIPESIRALRK